MSHDDQLRWDRQHAAQRSDEKPSSFLVEILGSGDWPLSAGRALDVACGKGRHALYLAERGFHVTGIDISAVALAEARRRALSRSLSVDFLQADLEAASLAEADVIAWQSDDFSLALAVESASEADVSGLPDSVSCRGWRLAGA